MFSSNDIDETVILGEGTTSTVFSTKDGKYAYKSYTDIDEDCFLSEESFMEITILKALQDTRFTQTMINPIFEKNKVGFFMKRYPYSLADKIKSAKGENGGHVCCLDFNVSKKIVYQVLVALYHADRKLIIHGDVKPGNILLDESNNIILTDWSHSKITKTTFDQRLSLCVQTLHYKSPEIFLCNRSYTSKIDVWSVGVLLYQLIKGSLLIKEEYELDQFRKICEIFGVPDESQWETLKHEHLKYPSPIYEIFEKRDELSKQDFPSTSNELVDDLLMNMLKLNPEERFSVTQAINHEFFDDIRDDIFEETTDLVKVNSLTRLSLEYQPNKVQFGYIKTILDWSLKVVNSISQHKKESYLLVVDFVYRLYNRFTKNDYHLLTISCIYLVSYILENYGLWLSDIHIITSSIYTNEQINNMVNDVYTRLNGVLYWETSVGYINALCDNSDLKSKIKVSKDDIISLIIECTKYIEYSNFSKITLVLAVILQLNDYEFRKDIMAYCENLDGFSNYELSRALKFIQDIRFSKSKLSL